MKYCPHCQTSKSLNEFYKNSLRKDGVQWVCIACFKQRKYKKTEHSRLKDIEIRRNKKFNITNEWYKQKLTSQDNVCAICQSQCKTGKALAVDHDHKSNVNRGLLCMECNTALGKFKDDPKLLQRAITYLADYAASK